MSEKRNQRTSDKEEKNVKQKKVLLLSKEGAHNLVSSMGKLPSTLGNQIIKVQNPFAKLSMPDLNLATIENLNSNLSTRKLSGKIIFHLYW